MPDPRTDPMNRNSPPFFPRDDLRPGAAQTEDPFAQQWAGNRRQFLMSAGAMATVPVAGCQQAVPPLALPRVGLDFPGSAGVRRTMRFRFLNPLAIYPATYIWRAYPRRQAGYYTAFFWGNDDGRDDLRTFLWSRNAKADSFYGAHPYPQPPPKGSNHRWEIAVLQKDLLGEPVQYDRWYTQAFRAWSSVLGKHHEFYWNLPLTDDLHSVTFTAPADWGNAAPPVPALTWGDAPWAPGNEVWNGMLSGIQVYQACLSVNDILAEAAAPSSTSLGRHSLWYQNLAPTPHDISDHSGRGHHPEWVGDERPALWTSATG